MESNFLGSLLHSKKRIVILATGLVSYGPLVQGLIIAADICSCCNAQKVELEIIARKSFFYDFERFYGQHPPVFRQTSSAFLDRIFSFLPLRLFFTSIIIPLARASCTLVYLDDTGSLVPWAPSHSLMHSPISVYDYDRLRTAQVEIGFVRYVLQKLYLLLVAHLGRSSFATQSAYVAAALSTNLFVASARICCINTELIARNWHPFLGRYIKTQTSPHEKNPAPFSVRSVQSSVPAIDLLDQPGRNGILCCCSPRTHKNPYFILDVALRNPSLNFFCTLPVAFFPLRILPRNLVMLGTLPHGEVLDFMAHPAILITFFPSLMETYGYPVLESVLLGKPCLIPREQFFDVHNSLLVYRYSPGSVSDASRVIEQLVLKESV